ncbi:MAG: LysR family transcriptional regulator [Gemmatimonadaceae bacterium]
MSNPDLNLLIVLDVLLTEGSVARAAQRLRLSPSAMSRALGRLRRTTGDPLLVRAGRGLVPTPRALELREQVGQLVTDAQRVLRPTKKLRLKQLTRIFTFRSSDGFAENFGAELIARAHQDAPGVQLRFVQKHSKDSVALREGSVDLETGVVEEMIGPEVRAQALFRDRLVGAVRSGHAFAKRKVSLARFLDGKHIVVSRRGIDEGPVHEVLAAKALKLDVATIVSGFSTALALARTSDLIATVPERHSGNMLAGMFSFPIPLELPEITISLLWHPRMDADLAHRWMRGVVRDVCGSARRSVYDESHS